MKLIYSIKETLKENDKGRKTLLLALVPDDWSINRSSLMIVILATPRKYSREGIDRATKLLITEFYECDAVSCICPEKRICVCMHHQNVKLMIHAVNPSLDYKIF